MLSSRPYFHVFAVHMGGDDHTNGKVIHAILNNLGIRKNSPNTGGGCVEFLVPAISVAALFWKKRNQRFEYMAD